MVGTATVAGMSLAFEEFTHAHTLQQEREMKRGRWSQVAAH